MKPNLGKQISLLAIWVLCAFSQGCMTMKAPSISAERKELMTIRRDRYAEKIASTWVRREKEEWSSVAVPIIASSPTSAEQVFYYAIRKRHVFPFSDIVTEDLIVAEPVKIGQLWFGFVDGYSSPLFLIAEDGKSSVYNVDVSF